MVLFFALPFITASGIDVKQLLIRFLKFSKLFFNPIKNTKTKYLERKKSVQILLFEYFTRLSKAGLETLYFKKKD